jgi:hypothetical protein
MAGTANQEPMLAWEQEDRSHAPERRHSLLSHRLSRSTDALREITDNLPETLVSWGGDREPGTDAGLGGADDVRCGQETRVSGRLSVISRKASVLLDRRWESGHNAHHPPLPGQHRFLVRGPRH